jgi:hypothetical protein
MTTRAVALAICSPAQTPTLALNPRVTPHVAAQNARSSHQRVHLTGQHARKGATAFAMAAVVAYAQWTAASG